MSVIFHTFSSPARPEHILVTFLRFVGRFSRASAALAAAIDPPPTGNIYDALWQVDAVASDLSNDA